MASHDFLRASWNTPEAVDFTASQFDMEPPAYSERTLFRGIAPISRFAGRHIACCAFQKLDANTHPLNSQTQLQKSPQLRLVSWVLLCRIADDSIPIKERFSCPMAKCDMVFDGSDYMELVHHVSGCQHLSEGMYRCPYHETPHIERFMEASRSHRTRKFFKGRFFKQTISKICDLGSRGRRARAQSVQRDFDQSNFDEKSPTSASTKRPFPDDDPIPTSFPELLPSSMADYMAEPTPDHLSVPQSYHHMPHQVPVEIDSYPRDDIPGEDDFTLTGPTIADALRPADDGVLPSFELPANIGDTFAEMEAPNYTYPSELSDKRLSSSSTQSFSLDSLTPESGLSPISPMTPRSIYSTEGFDLPVSPADVFHYENVSSQLGKMPNGGTTTGMEPPSFIPRPSISPIVDDPAGAPRRPSRQIPHIRVDTSCNTPPPVEEVSPFSSIPSESPASETFELVPPVLTNGHETNEEDDVANAKQLVQELRGLFNCLFKLSMRKLCQPSVTEAGALLLGMQPSAAQLFTSGVAALRKIVRGEAPQDFFEILGLSILPYACGVASMNENMQDQFGVIFQEQLRWSEAIIDEQLRKTYFELVWELWSTTQFQMPAAYNVSQQLFAPDVDKPAQELALEKDFFAMSDFGFGGAANSTGVGAAMNLGFHTSLFSVHDTAISLCLDYLDAFEYLQVNIQEMTTSAQDTPGFGYVPSGPQYSSVLMQQVMQPLSANVSLGTFKPVVDVACFLINETQNITLRSTELSLLEEGKGQRNAPLLFQDFAGEVHKLCENAAVVMGCPGYRSFYHMNDIDKIMEIHHELLAIERYQRVHRSRSSSLGSGKGKSPLNMSPASSGHSESLASTPHRSYAFTFSSNSSSPIDAGIYHSRNNSSENIFAAGGRPSAFSFSQSPTTRPSGSVWSRPHPSKRVNVSAPNGAAARSADPPAKTNRPEDKVQRQCPHCGQRFEQQAQYIKANITRHIREKHNDNVRKLVCGEPGCSYTSTRRGNLTHHQRTIHGVVPRSGEA